jgi:repressor LexA
LGSVGGGLSKNLDFGHIDLRETYDYSEFMKSFLTPKQKNILEFIKNYTQRHDYAPSQQEIAQNFGFKSLGTVQHYLVQLASQGYLEKSWNARRGTRVSGLMRSSSYELPLLGKVAAGRPIEAIETRDTIEVPSFMIKETTGHFVLHVQGDSMIGEGILEGDYVVFRKQATAFNGQTVVALINNEATIKKYFKRKNTVELHSANSAYKPIVVDDRKDFRIEGILAGVIRKIS